MNTRFWQHPFEMLAQPRRLTFPHKFSAGFSSPIVLHLLMRKDDPQFVCGFFCVAQHVQSAEVSPSELNNLTDQPMAKGLSVSEHDFCHLEQPMLMSKAASSVN